MLWGHTFLKQKSRVLITPPHQSPAYVGRMLPDTTATHSTSPPVIVVACPCATTRRGRGRPRSATRASAESFVASLSVADRADLTAILDGVHDETALRRNLRRVLRLRAQTDPTDRAALALDCLRLRRC